jgi:F0F1-type ATP synthase membrane subunit b/b'
MIGAGTFINPLLKIITTVVILGAIYLFFVKPVLDTTNNTIDRAFESTEPAFKQFSKAQKEADQQLRQAGISQDKALKISKQAQNEADKLLNCLQKAGSNTDELTACGQKFSG